MAKPELGLKRLCLGCGAKYYDLNRAPISCPKCGTIFEERQVASHRAARLEAVAPIEEEEETAVADAPTGDVELVPLEDAEEGDAAEDKTPAFADENEEMEEFTKEVVEDEFIEDEEDDVAELIEGDVDEADEEER